MLAVSRRSEDFELRRVEDIDHGADGVEIGRGHRAAEDQRARPDLQELAHPLGAGDEAAVAGEGL